MIIKNAEFLISVAEARNLLDLGLDEFVFVGRSNSGKSSLINFLTNKKNLAKTSSTPGLTKLINYFLINNKNTNKIIEKIKTNQKLTEEEQTGLLLVDLPGYGYSLAGKTRHELWSALIDTYLKTSKSIKKVFVLVDIRHEPNLLDKQMIQYLYFNSLPFVVLATKADKIAKSKIKGQINMIAKELKLAAGNIIPCSSYIALGKEEILSIFDSQD